MIAGKARVVFLRNFTPQESDTRLTAFRTKTVAADSCEEADSSLEDEPSGIGECFTQTYPLYQALLDLYASERKWEQIEVFFKLVCCCCLRVRVSFLVMRVSAFTDT